MGVINFISKFKVQYYQKGSIYKADERDRVVYYLPLREEVIDYEDYTHRPKRYLLENTLVPLVSNSDKYSLVKEPIVVFTLLESFCINNNESEDEFTENSMDYIKTLFNDIKEMECLLEFNNLGVSEIIINCIIQEVWTQGMEDWNCYLRYVGVIEDRNMDVESIVTKKSKERLERESNYLFG